MEVVAVWAVRTVIHLSAKAIIAGKFRFLDFSINLENGLGKQKFHAYGKAWNHRLISFVSDNTCTETAKIIDSFLIAPGNPVPIIGSAMRMVYQTDGNIAVLGHPFVAFNYGQLFGHRLQERWVERAVIQSRKRLP